MQREMATSFSAAFERTKQKATQVATTATKAVEDIAQEAASETSRLVNEVTDATGLTHRTGKKAVEMASDPAEADDKVRESRYWLKRQTFRSGDLNSCRLGGRLYPDNESGTGWRHMCHDMMLVFINELLASTVFGGIIFLMLTIMHESQQTGPVLTYFMAAIIIVASAFVINLVFPHVHMNPNLTLNLFLRECFAGTHYLLESGGNEESKKQRYCWRIMRCALRTVVQIGCQMLGFIVAAIAVYYSDYMRHLHRVAQANSLQPLPAAFFLDLGQTIPNESLEIGEWNAWGMEFVATFFFIFVVAQAIEINTQNNMDAYKNRAPSAVRLHNRGQTNSAWEGIYLQVPVLLVLAVDLVVLGNMTGASMNWARSFGPAWYAYNQRKNDPVGISDADPFSGLRHLWGYVVAQTIAVVLVNFISCVSMWIERRRLAQILGVPNVEDVDKKCEELEQSE